MSAKLRWVIAIVGLLGVNVVATVVLAVAANDGETQIIPAYYEKAAHYDDMIDQARTNRALGWHAAVAFARDSVDVVVSDAHGAALDGAHVMVVGYQRAHAARELAIDLAAVGGGRYHAATHQMTGMHDLTIDVVRDGAHFTQRAAVEVR